MALKLKNDFKEDWNKDDYSIFEDDFEEIVRRLIYQYSGIVKHFQQPIN